MKKIKLSPRLLAISNLVRQNSVASDIGTDHGLLIGYLAQNNIISKGYACDINEQPLESAIETINDYNLGDKIKPVLTNGLNNLDNKGITDIIIAGMGGNLIADILSEADWIKDSKYSFVLQAMSRDYILREYLLKNGFNILEEKAVVDGDFVYSIIKAVYDGVKREESVRFYWTGLIWDKTDNDSIEYLELKYRTLEKMKLSFNIREGYEDMFLELKERLGK